MTYPRSHLVDADGGTYHVTSRCVRRAYLCGDDPLTGYNFDHRRKWLERRIHKLAKVFSVDLLGYAVMSNHYHLILSTQPTRSKQWSDIQVASQWVKVFPGSGKSGTRAIARQERIKQILNDPRRIQILRERLGSLSWFMRCLNEPLARIANTEDDCKGRFWEGRFKSQQILDETALLACLVYVDLNPIRAGLADKIEEAEHTSIFKRLHESEPDTELTALNEPHNLLGQGYTLREYLALLEWTATSQQSVRPMNNQVLRCIQKASDANTEEWFTYLPRRGVWQRALGSKTARSAYAASIGQRWIKSV